MHCLKHDVKCIRTSLEAPGTEIGVPVGSVEFVRAYMALNAFKEPSWNCYPDIGGRYYHRQISRIEIGKVSLEKVVFVKPVKTKLFNGFLLEPDDKEPSQHVTEQLEAIRHLPTDTEVYVSSPINLIYEMRYYIQEEKIIGKGRYDDHDQEFFYPNQEIVQEMIRCIGIKTPYALDIGLTQNQETVLIEINDAWAIGLYDKALSDTNYANFLKTRWDSM